MGAACNGLQKFAICDARPTPNVDLFYKFLREGSVRGRTQGSVDRPCFPRFMARVSRLVLLWPAWQAAFWLLLAVASAAISLNGVATPVGESHRPPSRAPAAIDARPDAADRHHQGLRRRIRGRNADPDGSPRPATRSTATTRRRLSAAPRQRDLHGAGRAGRRRTASRRRLQSPPVTFTIDTAAPTASITGGPSGTVGSGAVTFTFDVQRGRLHLPVQDGRGQQQDQRDRVQRRHRELHRRLRLAHVPRVGDRRARQRPDGGHSAHLHGRHRRPDRDADLAGRRVGNERHHADVQRQGRNRQRGSSRDHGDRLRRRRRRHRRQDAHDHRVGRQLVGDAQHGPRSRRLHGARPAVRQRAEHGHQQREHLHGRRDSARYDDHRRTGRLDLERRRDVHLRLGGRRDLPVPGRREPLHRLRLALHVHRPQGGRPQGRHPRDRRRGQRRSLARDAELERARSAPAGRLLHGLPRLAAHRRHGHADLDLVGSRQRAREPVVGPRQRRTLQRRRDAGGGDDAGRTPATTRSACWSSTPRASPWSPSRRSRSATARRPRRSPPRPCACAWAAR